MSRPKPWQPERTHVGSIFVDSGAFSIFAKHVVKRTGKKETLLGTHGKPLEPPAFKWGSGDFSHYDLSPGTEFRKYCDRYAKFIRRYSEKDPDMLFVNVDCMSNPEKTWEIQRYFEDEHGVTPVPVLHFMSTLKNCDRYLETGRYDFVGFGGIDRKASKLQYRAWCDGMFTHICPESNDFKPVVRVHGFAITSSRLLCRYPWWSVDSTAWLRQAAYGTVYVPYSNDAGEFDFEKRPSYTHYSRRPDPKLSYRHDAMIYRHGEHDAPAPAQASGRMHWDSMHQTLKAQTKRWFDFIKPEIDKLEREHEDLIEAFSNEQHVRCAANLLFFTELQNSRPKWPWPLDVRIRRAMKRAHRPTNILESL